MLHVILSEKGATRSHHLCCRHGPKRKTAYRFKRIRRAVVLVGSVAPGRNVIGGNVVMRLRRELDKVHRGLSFLLGGADPGLAFPTDGPVQAQPLPEEGVVHEPGRGPRGRRLRDHPGSQEEYQYRPECVIRKWA